MAKQIQTRPNALGIGGWAYAGRYKLERYLFISHRATGLALLLFFLIYLIRITILQLQGQDSWVATLLIVHSRWFGAVTALFIFHAVNGLRLSLQETGVTMGKPGLPSYPYTDALRKTRPFTITMLAVSILMIVAFLFVFFVLGVW